MPYPRKANLTRTPGPMGPLPQEAVFSPEEIEKYKDMEFDEVLATMANQNKALLAKSIIEQINKTGDPTAFKLLQISLDRVGGLIDKELPVSNEKFEEIIRIAASRLRPVGSG